MYLKRSYYTKDYYGSQFGLLTWGTILFVLDGLDDVDTGGAPGRIEGGYLCYPQGDQGANDKGLRGE